MQKGMVIAIDGPVASGKGTIAKLLVDRLHAANFYTGGMYRAVAYYCLKNGIDLKSEEKVVEALDSMEIDLKDPSRTGSYSSVFLNGEDITEKIVESHIADASPITSSYAEVRRRLVQKQQALAQKALDEGKIIVMEGRDIGTVVFPNADLKIFLTADVKTRAKRRKEQYESINTNKSLEDMIEEIKTRDLQDTSRAESPLPSDPKSLGYIILDDSSLSEKETLEVIVKKASEKGFVTNEN